MNIKFKITVISVIIICSVNAFSQIYFNADPYDLVIEEYNAIKKNRHITALNLRPAFNYSTEDTLTIKYYGEMFYNNGAPNLENMSNKVIGKGFGIFNSINVSYKNKYILASIEPYYYFNQNQKYNKPDRPELFSHLIDNNSHYLKSPISDIGIRELQLYIHWNGLGIGFSNANIWWGPGLHSAIIMSNNAPGFNTIQLGTIEEIRYKNWEFISRFIFSKFDKRNIYEPYFSAIFLGATYYSNPIISIGLTKSNIIGGNNPSSDEVEWYDALFSVFSNFGSSGGDWEKHRQAWSLDDNNVTLFLSMVFPRSSLKFFFELGKTDTFFDLFYLSLIPDHAIATNIGFRKYGIFNNENIYFGSEYIKLITSRYLDRAFTGPWYLRPQYEYNSFDGRYYGAHSGPDSNDLFIFGGYNKNELRVQFSIDYERYGMIAPYYEHSPDNEKLIDPDNYYPEAKIEYRTSIEYDYKGYKLGFNIEHERVSNYEFKDNNKRSGTVMWIGLEKKINFY